MTFSQFKKGLQKTIQKLALSTSNISSKYQTFDAK